MTMTNEELKQALDASPSPNRLTLQDIIGQIASEEYLTRGTAVICILILKNGHVISEVSGALDPVNFREEIGQKVARDRAVSKIWELEGYAFRDRGGPRK